MLTYVLDSSSFQGYYPYWLQFCHFRHGLQCLLHMLRFLFLFLFFSLILRCVDILSWFCQIYGSFSQQSEEIKICSKYENNQWDWCHYCQLLQLVRKNVTLDSPATLPYFLEVCQGWLETGKREVSFEQHNFGIKPQPSLINCFRAKIKNASNCIHHMKLLHQFIITIYHEVSH